MVQLLTTLFCLLAGTACKNKDSVSDAAAIVVESAPVPKPSTDYATDILTGAEQTDLYLPLIKDKYVSCVVNQTSVIGSTHLVDSLLSLHVKINNIFAPEHGFRGTEDAGATILNAKDVKSGLPVISLYGAKKKPAWEDLADADIVLFDIQDVGARFYTYISTLHYVMEACAENKKKLIILDRPNPNGFYVDGPVLKKEFTSFVGMHPVPVVHGMTIGEYAQMVNGEQWLSNGEQCDLTVIPCKNYDHKKYYEIKIAPSPNLKSMRAIYLYPTLCFFEGTNVSVGRGTTHPFELFGSPYIKITAPSKFPSLQSTSFTPVSGPGSKNPPFMGQACFGYDFSGLPDSSLRDTYLHREINIQLIKNTYAQFSDGGRFFLENNFFNKLAGTDELMEQIKTLKTAEEIRSSWQEDLQAFKQIRKKYLLYPDFE